MNHNNFNKKIIAVLIAGIVIGVIAAPALKTQLAKANLFEDIWNNFISPFSQDNAVTTPQSVKEKKEQAYQPPLDYERAVIDAVKKASPAVVSITISKYVPIIEQCPYSPFDNLPPNFRQFFGDGGNTFYTPCDTGKKELQEVGGGSGFIISSDGLILTNKHVVSDTKASYTVFTNDGKKYSAAVLARDPVQDLAVVKIDAENLSIIELGDSDQLELGQTVIAIGNALGEYRNTVSTGVVSGLSRTVTAGGADFGQETIRGVIQTDAAINPGNSGGPLLDSSGRLIGVNTSIYSPSGASAGIGFAIPVDEINRIVPRLIRDGKFERPVLGVQYAPAQLLPALGLKNGVAVLDVVPGGPAGIAGLKPFYRNSFGNIVVGDVIVAIDDRAVENTDDLFEAFEEHQPGDRVVLTVLRGKKQVRQRLTVKLASPD